MSNYPPNNHYFASNSRLESASDMGSAYELRPWKGSHYSSMGSVTASLYGSRSMLSMYTPSQASYYMPIHTDGPNIERKPADNWGLAFFSLFFNPLFGIVAILLAEMSRDYFNRCKYIQASKYGSYAKGVACGGIATTVILLALIIAMLLHYYLKFYY